MYVTRFADITGAIIGFAREVYRVLGKGYREEVYLRALARAIAHAGFRVTLKKSFTVAYQGGGVATVIADADVEGKVLLEVKARKEGLSSDARDQLLSNLRAANREVGLLLNFNGPEVGVRRVVNNAKE